MQQPGQPGMPPMPPGAPQQQQQWMPTPDAMPGVPSGLEYSALESGGMVSIVCIIEQFRSTVKIIPLHFQSEAKTV